MTDTQKLKAILLEEQAQLVASLGTVAVRDPHNPGGYAAIEGDQGHGHTSDDNDLADELEELGNNSAITRDLETRLEIVNKALTDLEEGTYGVCNECDADIEEDRLGADPAAQTCKIHME